MRNAFIKNMRTACLAVAALSCLSLTACNTVEGFGRDMERGGESVQDAAD